MPRTTIRLEPHLLKALKERAAREGRTLQDLVNDLLLDAFRRQESEGAYQLELQGWKASERPGVDLLDRDRLYDLMEGH